MALFSFRKKAGIPHRRGGPPRPGGALPVPAQDFMTRRPIKPPFPEGLEQAVFGMGCFWGAERKFWQPPACTRRRWATPAASPEPDLRGGVLGLTGHAEVVLVVFDPDVVELRHAAEGVLGEPRPDAGHAAGQRRRHAVPLGDLHVRRRAAAAARGVARGVQGALEARATARSRPRSRRRRPSTTPRTTTSSTSPRTRTATAASAAPAWRAPWEPPPPMSGRSDPRRAHPGENAVSGCSPGSWHLRLALHLPRGAVQCGSWSRS